MRNSRKLYASLTIFPVGHLCKVPTDSEEANEKLFGKDFESAQSQNMVSIHVLMKFFFDQRRVFYRLPLFLQEQESPELASIHGSTRSFLAQS